MSCAKSSTIAAAQRPTARRHLATPGNAPLFLLALVLVLGSAPASAQQQPEVANDAKDSKAADPAPPAGSWIKEKKPAPKKASKPPQTDAAAQGAAAAKPEAAPEKVAPAPAQQPAEQKPAAPAADVKEAAPPAPLPAPPLPAPLITKLPPAPVSSVSSGDDFDLLAPAPVLDKAQLAQANLLEEKLATRRSMLGLHQVAGFVNLAGVATAVVLGQLNYNDKYAGGGDTEKYITAHKVAAFSSAGIFAATGLLALLAPSPIDQPTRLSNATVHKACMAVATAGMVAEVVLGIVAANKNGSLSQRDFALGHQIIGYTTAVATAGGFIAITW